MPELIAIAVGSLDAPETFRPQVVTYAGRALPWDMMDPALAHFDKMPG